MKYSLNISDYLGSFVDHMIEKVLKLCAVKAVLHINTFFPQCTELLVVPWGKLYCLQQCAPMERTMYVLGKCTQVSSPGGQDGNVLTHHTVI